MMGESETDGIVPYGNSTVYRDGDDFYNIEEILDKPPGSNSTNANPVDNDGNGNDGIVFAIDDDLDAYGAPVLIPGSYGVSTYISSDSRKKIKFSNLLMISQKY